MQLKLGLMTNKELATWFGVSSGGFRNQKKKKLEELKNFAHFHQEKGKVYITDIIIPEYDKKIGKTKQLVMEKVDDVWSPNGLDTCSRVGVKIRNMLAESGIERSESTIINYTREGRNELYGKPFNEEGGTKGSCIYIWCKRDTQTGEYILLNEEEKQIKQELQVKYFGDATEKQIIVQGMIEAGEITEKEAWGKLKELTNMTSGHFLSFLQELQSKLGCQVVRGTLVERKGSN